MRDRCPACGAAVAAGAGWCTLCFADLRPAPADTSPASAHEPEAVPAVAPVATLAPPSAAAWPCSTCGAHVPLEESACPHCGTPFLVGESTPPIRLPRLGDPRDLSTGARAGVMVGGVLLVTGVLLLLGLVVGSLL